MWFTEVVGLDIELGRRAGGHWEVQFHSVARICSPHRISVAAFFAGLSFHQALPDSQARRIRRPAGSAGPPDSRAPADPQGRRIRRHRRIRTKRQMSRPPESKTS